MALICNRDTALQKLDNIFIAKITIDFHLVSDSSHVFLLYNKENKNEAR